MQNEFHDRIALQIGHMTLALAQRDAEIKALRAEIDRLAAELKKAVPPPAVVE